MSEPSTWSVLDGKSVFSAFGYEGSHSFEDDEVFPSSLDAPLSDVTEASAAAYHHAHPHHRQPADAVHGMMEILGDDTARKMSADTSRLVFNSATQFQATPSGRVASNQAAAIMPKTQYPAGFNMGRRVSYDNSFFNDVEAMSQLAHRSDHREEESSDILSNLRSIYESAHGIEEPQSEQTEPEPSPQQMKVYQPTSKKLLRIHSSPNMLSNMSDLSLNRDRQKPDVVAVNADKAVVKAAFTVETPATSAAVVPVQSATTTATKPSEVTSEDAPKLPENSSSTTPTSGFLHQTRRLGAWLSKAAGQRPLDLTQRDMNSIVPNTF